MEGRGQRGAGPVEGGESLAWEASLYPAFDMLD